MDAVETRSHLFGGRANTTSRQGKTIGRPPSEGTSTDRERTAMESRRIIPFAAYSAALLLAPPVFAQSGSASVGGVARSQDDGSALWGATVEVVGTSTVALSDEAGRYRLRGITPGTISLRFTRIGYTTLTRTVTLGADEAAVVDAQLGEAPLRGESSVASSNFSAAG